jgi:hypothetical protein
MQAVKAAMNRLRHCEPQRRRVGLDRVPHPFRNERNVVPSAGLRVVAHEFGNLAERLTLMREVAAERAARMQTTHDRLAAV